MTLNLVIDLQIDHALNLRRGVVPETLGYTKPFDSKGAPALVNRSVNASTSATANDGVEGEFATLDGLAGIVRE
jgi:hypothetical protein